MRVKGKTGQLKSFRGDGTYDDFKVREALGEEVTRIILSPKMQLSIRDLKAVNGLFEAAK